MTSPRLALRLAFTGRRACVARARQAGYTLMELCIVAALILVLAAITLPSLTGMLVDARVNAGGDMIRGRLADARSMAMELGRPVRFGFIPGTGKFQIAPDDSSAWDTTTDSDPIEQDDLVRGELPEGVVFATDMNASNDSGTPSPGSNWEFGGVLLPEGGGRGPINPDGTTNDNVTFYFGKAGLSPLAVRLSGLTGTARVFDPTADGEQP
jgi:prepilin-type N-terminal cleavage/methylation domain-containing protein